MTQPQDPVCPACGEAVGSTSSYCMHCDADFDAPIDESEWTGGDAEERQSGEWGAGTEPEPASDWGDSDQSVTEHPSGWDEGGAGDDDHTEGWTPDDESTASTGDDSTASTSTTPETTSDYGTTGSAGDSVEHTEDADGGTGRNLLQSAARISAVLLTVFAGLLTTVTLMILTVEVIELWIPLLLVALVAIVTGVVVVARQDTGIDALADAFYITAATLVGLPFIFVLFLPSGDPIVERILAGAVFSLFGAFIGVPLFVVGWWLQPDDEEIPWT